MRALLPVVLVVASLALGPTASAAPTPAPPQPRCTFTDERLDEVSGLADGPDGLSVVNDSGNAPVVYALADDCGVGEETAFRRGADVEDLARAPDGTLWIADVGDNRRTRSQVAVVRVLPGGEQLRTPLVYGDGPHDAETLLVAGDGRPVIVTKDVGGRSGVYTTPAPLPPVTLPDGDPPTLARVAEVALPPSRTPNGGADPSAALFGGGLLTGGAVSADGRVAALRTYTDAWLYPVTATGTADGLVAALRGAPVQVPLPGEPQGEAIAFTADGTLLSAGESPERVSPSAVSPRGQLRAVPGAASMIDTERGTPTPGTWATPATPPTSPAAAGEPDRSQEDESMDPVLWIGVAVAVVAGVGGVLLALRKR